VTDPAAEELRVRWWLGVLVAMVSLCLAGCCECFLHELIALNPAAYSGGGNTEADKHDDLDRRLEESKNSRVD
jgi:hypothetical protein